MSQVSLFLVNIICYVIFCSYNMMSTPDSLLNLTVVARVVAQELQDTLSNDACCFTTTRISVGLFS